LNDAVCLNNVPRNGLAPSHIPFMAWGYRPGRRAGKSSSKTGLARKNTSMQSWTLWRAFTMRVGAASPNLLNAAFASKAWALSGAMSGKRTTRSKAKNGMYIFSSVLTPF
jgi:hypothetical protein